MRSSDPRTTVRRFLEVLDGEGPAGAEEERRLRLLLDELVLCVYGMPTSAPETDVDAPRPDAEALRARVAARFPGYGRYPTASLDPREEPADGDAADDLTAIALDLFEVEWRWEHVGERDALWRLVQSFETHWGEPLRGLQLYLRRRGT